MAYPLQPGTSAHITLEAGVPMDAVFLFATLAFFTLAWAYGHSCEHI